MYVSGIASKYQSYNSEQNLCYHRAYSDGKENIKDKWLKYIMLVTNVKEKTKKVKKRYRNNWSKSYNFKKVRF